MFKTGTAISILFLMLKIIGFDFSWSVVVLPMVVGAILSSLKYIIIVAIGYWFLK